MFLRRIVVDGFKSIRSADLELSPINVLIGANGVGKSNFISLFKILNRMVAQDFQEAVAVSGGADSLLFLGEKNTEKIGLRLFFGQNEYRAIWVPTSADNLIFKSEICAFAGEGYRSPYTETLGTGHKESKLAEASASSKVVEHVFESLKSWRVYHFHDTSDAAKVKKVGSLNDNMTLRSDAANLASYLNHLKSNYPKNYFLIRDAVALVAPFFKDFLLRPMPENEEKIRLEWYQKGAEEPFLAHHFSDGTLRFVCLATALLQPIKPKVILIDEPELGLHPYAISILASLVKSAASSDCQVIISTQSVSLLNHFEVKDVVVAERSEHASKFMRLETTDLREWLGEFSLGEMWERNVFGGRPTRE